MLYIIYSTDKFKNTILNFIKAQKFIKTQDINFLNIHTQSEQAILDILDKASGYIMEFSPKTKTKALILYSSAKFVGIPGIITAENVTGPLNQALLKTLRNYIPLSNKSLIKTALQKMYRKNHITNNPIHILRAQENIIHIDKPQKAEIYYTHPTQLNTNKPILIFTHGITARATTYIEMLQILSKHFNVFTIDLPYHGKSSNLSKYPTTLNEFSLIITQVIETIIKRHELKQQNFAINLMGHSLGGAIMFYSAYKLEQKRYNLQHIYLLNPAGARINENITKLTYLTTIYKLLNLKRYYVLDNNLKRAIAEVLMNHIRNLRGDTPQMVKRFAKIIPKGFTDFNKIYIHTPTTIVFADGDGYFSHEYRYRFSQRFQCANIVEVHGSHDWPIIKPQYITNIIKPFINTQNTRLVTRNPVKAIYTKILNIIFPHK